MTSAFEPPSASDLVPPMIPGVPSGSGTSVPPRAGFGVRLGGWILDITLYGLLGSILVTPGFVLLLRSIRTCDAAGECVSNEASDATIAVNVALMAVGLCIVFVVYIWALASTGQTWGRKIVGVKVVSEKSGEPLGVGKAVGRQLFAWLLSGQVLYIGYLWALWDSNQQTWHDKIVGSIVVTV